MTLTTKHDADQFEGAVKTAAERVAAVQGTFTDSDFPTPGTVARCQVKWQRPAEFITDGTAKKWDTLDASDVNQGQLGRRDAFPCCCGRCVRALL